MQTSKKKPSLVFLLLGAVLAGYLGYLIGGAWEQGINLMDFMERFSKVCEAPFANYYNENTIKMIAIVVVVYAMAVVMYYTSQRNYMPGREFGTAKLESPAKVNKILMDKDENFNRILSQNVKMSLDFRRLKLNGNILICGGSGAGKTFYEVKPNLMQMPHNCSFICTDPKGEILRSCGEMLKNNGYNVKVTLSYAEIKAVATGNPMIKEKMEIDNDVQRLKLLKASYDNQRYSLQDNFMIRYPKLIKAATEKLACVREDIKARDKELIDNPDFAITVGKFTYTERADGGAVMLEAISKCKTGETSALGSFHGFELLVEKNFMGTHYLILRGKTEYKVELSTSPVGNMVKLENCFNGIHENEEFLLKKVEQYENDLKASKEEYEKPFMHEEELQEKLSRQFELNALLDLENEKVADADLGGMEEDKSMNVAENEVPYQTRQDKQR